MCECEMPNLMAQLLFHQVCHCLVNQLLQYAAASCCGAHLAHSFLNRGLQGVRCCQFCRHCIVKCGHCSCCVWIGFEGAPGYCCSGTAYGCCRDNSKRGIYLDCICLTLRKLCLQLPPLLDNNRYQFIQESIHGAPHVAVALAFLC